MSTTTLGSSLGTGGMETKLIAADISTAAGVTTIITSSKHPENVFSIIEYDVQNSPGKLSKSNSSGSSPSTPPLIRPPHTLFTAAPEPMRDLKSWTSHTLNPSGSVIIDTGAYHVLSKRESGGRLLAAGVIGCVGAFAAGTAVRIVIRQRHIGHEEREQERRAYLRALESTRPSSPTTAAAFEEHDAEELNRDADVVLVDKGAEIGETDVIEVGRGLANYNSAQIMAVKGLNRCVRVLLSAASADNGIILVLCYPRYWAMQILNTWSKISRSACPSRRRRLRNREFCRVIPVINATS